MDKRLAFQSTEIPILWSQMDANGHVGNGTYQFIFDEARMRALEHAGFSIAQLRKDEIGPVMLKAELTYHKPVSHPDSVRIDTDFGDGNKIKGKIFQNMYRVSDGQLVCEAIFLAIFFDFKKSRPMKLPDFFVSRFSYNH